MPTATSHSHASHQDSYVRARIEAKPKHSPLARSTQWGAWIGHRDCQLKPD